MKPTLLVLAAGMGSRYGSLKQIDPVGPSGETIIDYSIYDAIRAGYGKIVFIIRKSFEKEFKELFISKLKGLIEVEYVFQELENIPSEFKIPAEREKPWGTGHAVLMAKECINEPFTVINGDDFYGAGAFAKMSDYLSALGPNQQNQFSLVGYQVGNTLSENGSVARGVCISDSDNNLVSVTERTNIKYTRGGIAYQDEDGTLVFLKPETPVSMNFWGFTPDYFKQTEKLFYEFLINRHQELKSEFYIPLAVDTMIKNQTAIVKVLTSNDKWFGVTYKEDKPIVIQKIADLVKVGLYPNKLF